MGLYTPLAGFSRFQKPELSSDIAAALLPDTGSTDLTNMAYVPLVCKIGIGAASTISQLVSVATKEIFGMNVFVRRTPMPTAIYTDSKYRSVANDLPDHLFEKLVSDIRDGKIVSTWKSTNDFSHTMLCGEFFDSSAIVGAEKIHLVEVAYHLWEHTDNLSRPIMYSYNILTHNDACRLAEVFGAPTPAPVDAKKLPFPRYPAYVVENCSDHMLREYNPRDFAVHGRVRRQGSQLLFETMDDASLFTVAMC